MTVLSRIRSHVTVLSLFFIILYFVGAIGIGTGLSITVWSKGVTILSWLALFGVISFALLFVWCIFLWIGQGMAILRPQPPKIPSNEEKFRWLHVQYLFQVSIIVYYVTCLVAFAFTLANMKPFSLLYASLLAIWFESTAIIFVRLLHYFRCNMFGMNFLSGASAFASLSLKLPRKQDNESLRFLEISLLMARQALSEEELSLHSLDEVSSIISIFRSHSDQIPHEDLMELASGVANLPLGQKLAEAISSFVSKPSVAWASMYKDAQKTRMPWDRLLVQIAPILALLLSLVSEDTRKYILEVLQKPEMRIWEEASVAFVAYFSLTYALRPVLEVVENWLPRKYLAQMK